MSDIVYRITKLLSTVVMKLPIGTNLALFHLLWTLLGGRLLTSRGAVIPALAQTGLPADAVRRAWAALAYGAWDIATLLDAWQNLVTAEGHFHPHRHGGYRPVAADTIGFFRPRLHGCPTQHFAPPAGKALPAIPLGVVVSVGSVNQQRLPLPRALVRADAQQPTEAHLQTRLLQTVNTLLESDEALVSDRGFSLAAVQAAGVTRYVCRVRKNFTARRADPPPYQGRGRKPTRGFVVRPLPRRRQGKTIAASVPDRVQTWTDGRASLRAEFFDRLVRSDAPAGAPTFDCVVIHDPRFAEPLVLATPLPLSGEDLRAFYRDRWVVEQLPLTAKQMLGAARQFVFADESRQRLPELSLLAGAILSYVAATPAAIPTGFWDRAPQPTAGRLRRVLERVDFSPEFPLPEKLRKKQSVTEPLPKGALGRRRHNAPLSAVVSVPSS